MGTGKWTGSPSLWLLLLAAGGKLHHTSKSCLLLLLLFRVNEEVKVSPSLPACLHQSTLPCLSGSGRQKGEGPLENAAWAVPPLWLSCTTMHSYAHGEQAFSAPTLVFVGARTCVKVVLTGHCYGQQNK